MTGWTVAGRAGGVEFRVWRVTSEYAGEQVDGIETLALFCWVLHPRQVAVVSELADADKLLVGHVWETWMEFCVAHNIDDTEGENA